MLATEWTVPVFDVGDAEFLLAEGRIVDLEDTTPKAVKAIWYSIPVGLTLIGAMAWLVG